MNTSLHKSAIRRPLQGVSEVFRFNWPRYAAAPIVVLGIALLLRIVHLSLAMRICALLVIGLTAWWSIASLLASFWVYDFSELMTWQWLKRELPNPPSRWLNVHAGLDESTPSLQALWNNATSETVDIFAPEEMTEDSIRRARGETLSRPAKFDALPFPADAFDVLFLFFAAHELRRPMARRALFAETRRVLTPNGRALLVEHLRDVANFAAFGPGFLHFHSLRTWRADIEAAGLEIEREFPFTPFVQVFVLRRKP